MASRYAIKNDGSVELRVWLEPSCDQYTVPAGAKLTLLYEASDRTEIEVEMTPAQMTVYLNSDYAPDAELDGSAIDPDWQ